MSRDKRTTSKRTNSQSNSFQDEDETPAKAPKLSSTDAYLKYVNSLDKRMEKQTNEIKNLLNEFEFRLITELDKKMDEMKKELVDVSERVTKLESVVEELGEVRNEMWNIKKEINALKMQIKRQENSTIAADLRINGIPFSKDEDLLLTFNKICSTINLTTPAIKSIFRLQNENNKHKTNSQDAVIIVKMMSPYDKNFFLKTLSLFRNSNKNFNFRLSQIDSNVEPNSTFDNKFFVNENLTHSNYRLLQAAIKLKRGKKLCAAFSLRGIVYVKISPNDQPTRIDEFGDINKLFRDTPFNEEEIIN